MFSKIKLTIQNGSLTGAKPGADERINCIVSRDSASTICIYEILNYI